jgi:hypothetical protein
MLLFSFSTPAFFKVALLGFQLLERVEDDTLIESVLS